MATATRKPASRRKKSSRSSRAVRSTHASSAGKYRSSWKGQLSFGLVNFAVEAFNALDREQGDIHFHQLHAKCHSRIRYVKVCPKHGEISQAEIVSGYEYAKGKYVEIESDELEALREENQRTLKIDTFVSPGTIDPLYFDGRMYYLVPSEASAHEAYSVVVTAMAHEDREAIGHLVMSGKEQIVLLRPLDGLLHLAMLNFHAEIKPPETFASGVHKPKSVDRQVKLAQTLIADWTDEEFDFAKYENRHRDRLQELIDAKVHGREIVVPEEPEEETEVVNLMEALKKSLERAQGGTHRPKRKSSAHKRSA